LGLQETMKALSDETRREIIQMLKKTEMTAGDISKHFKISNAAISKHLSILKKADLIRDRKDGKFIIYELNTSVLEEVLLWISDLKGE